ncbi:MAG: AMIN domain-containing protein [Nitrospiria bacterium]
MKRDRIPGDDLYIKRVRIGQHPDKLRLVLDLNQAITFTWEQQGNQLRVTLR